jgi:hypothetical protein
VMEKLEQVAQEYFKYGETRDNNTQESDSE